MVKYCIYINYLEEPTNFDLNCVINIFSSSAIEGGGGRRGGGVLFANP